MNQSPAVATTNINSSAQPGSTGSATWINKLKIVGRGQNWAVAPCEPFYLMGTEPPAQDAALTGAKNLIEHYGLENAYQKFCGKRLREELSAFLPHLSGNIDVPASVDGSGLMSLIEKPPIRGKELRQFAPNQLDQAFRLHPGPLPQEYSSLFAAASPSLKHTNRGVCAGPGTRLPATAAPGLLGPGSFHRRRRRYEVHRGNTIPGSGGLTGISIPGTSGNLSSGSISFFAAPPSFPQLGGPHTGAPLSSGSLPPHAHNLSSTGHSTNSAAGTPSGISHSSHVDSVPIPGPLNNAKPVDLPPGLIPVSTPAPHIPMSSEPPPPPPLLAPIHQNIPQRSSNAAHLSSLNQNSVSNLPDTCSSVGPISVPKQSNPAPPLLHSVHTPITNNSGPAPVQLHYPPMHPSQSYPVMQTLSRSLSPNSVSQCSSPPSPDIYKIRRSDVTDEERRKKKKREKKRRKEKE